MQFLDPSLCSGTHWTRRQWPSRSRTQSGLLHCLGLRSLFDERLERRKVSQPFPCLELIFAHLKSACGQFLMPFRLRRELWRIGTERCPDPHEMRTLQTLKVQKPNPNRFKISIRFIRDCPEQVAKLDTLEVLSCRMVGRTNRKTERMNMYEQTNEQMNKWPNEQTERLN